MSVEAAAPAVLGAATMKPKNTSAKPKVAAAHPAFAVMIAAAVKALKERNGSSRQAILKYVLANYQAGEAAKAQVRVRMALKKLVEAKKLVAGGAAGKKGSGCFKLPVAVKAEKLAKKPAAKMTAKKPVAEKVAAKKPAAKKPAAKEVAKKPAAKKIQQQRSLLQQQRSLMPRRIMRIEWPAVALGKDQGSMGRAMARTPFH